MTVALKLSQIKPDFDSLLMQMQLFLQSTNTWSDLQTSSTGQTLLEMIAAVGTFNQFAIESAVRETTLTTAVRDSSVYAITRMLGVRIHRKSPAGVSATVSRLDSTTLEQIPTYTQFDVDGTSFFNRYPLMFPAGSLSASERLYYGSMLSVLDSRSFTIDASIVLSLKIKTNDRFSLLVGSGASAGESRTVVYLGGNVGNNAFRVVDEENPITDFTPSIRISLMRDTVQLNEGTVIEETFTSGGDAFQQYYLSNTKFTVSDIDVEVRVYDEQAASFIQWELAYDGIWLASQYDRVYLDSTSGDGDAIISFGDGINGMSPPLGTSIKIKYAVTSGSTANKGLTNIAVSLPSVNDTAGTTVSVISGGADEKPSSYYRAMAPLIFKARNRGVTQSDYKAVALDYPGIISVSVQAQRDIAPTDLRWMNQIQICLLPAAEGVYALTPFEWDLFMVHMDSKKHAAVNIVPKDPTRQNVNIDITLALKNQYVGSSVTPVADAQIRALFKRQSDTLGRRIAVSDVTKAALVAGVDYVVVNSCSLAGMSGISDLVPTDNTHFLEVASVVINTKYSEREVYL